MKGLKTPASARRSPDEGSAVTRAAVPVGGADGHSPVRKQQLTVPQTVVGICVVYTTLTLLSSALALAGGGTYDTHLHLLLRFGVTAVGVGAFYVYGRLRRRFARASSVVIGLGTYALALAVTMAGVWMSGRVETLHPDAYRDIFLNFTAVAIVLSGVWATVTWWRRPHGQ